MVRDRILPFPFPAAGRPGHAGYVHSAVRRHRKRPQRDLERRKARIHRGHGLQGRSLQRRGQAQGQVLRAPIPSHLPRRRRLLGTLYRRRLPVRAHRPALPQVPLGMQLAHPSICIFQFGSRDLTETLFL